MWWQDRRGWQRNGEEGEGEEEELTEKFLIKWNGMSYLHVSWETAEDLVKNISRLVNTRVSQKILQQ